MAYRVVADHIRSVEGLAPAREIRAWVRGWGLGLGLGLSLALPSVCSSLGVRVIDWSLNQGLGIPVKMPVA